MNADGIWKLFCETGDPNFYLACKAMERADEQKREQGAVPEVEGKGTDTGDPRI